MSRILGISAYFHDSSACLIIDGKVVAAIPEERLSRIKHDASFPEKAIRFCLEAGKITADDLDEVVFFEKPFTRFERILETFIKKAPRGFLPFRKAIFGWLGEKLWIEDHFRKTIGYKGTFSFCRHHLSHAALATGTSTFEDAAWLVIDGVGEKACTSYGTFEHHQLIPLEEQHFPHSVGLFYSAFTYYCGFKVNSGEYKLMGLAPYGQPRFAELIRQHLIQCTESGEVTLNTTYFGFLNDLKMINRRFERLLGKPARRAEEPMDDFYKDVAASAQLVLQEIVCTIARAVQRKTGKERLVFGGGVALNCVANTLLTFEQTGFREIHIHSASGDSGCAMGAAIWRAMELGEWHAKQFADTDFTGPVYSESQIREAVKKFGLNAQILANEELYVRAAEGLKNGLVTGWFRGASEFGPRALGNRSILADPRHPDMKNILNVRIKKREGFRPFAPVVLSDYFSDWFEDRGFDYSKMLYVTQAKTDKIPSCVHADGTARVQRVSREAYADLYNLLTRFYDVTGCPVLINTSMNERGEPMVCSPEDAIRCFLNTGMDALVLENTLILKEDNGHIQHQQLQYAPD